MNPHVSPTSVHGALGDSASGINLAFWSLLGLQDGPSTVLVPRIEEATGAGYSLLTDPRLGALGVQPTRAHPVFDAAKDPSVAASPWLFGLGRNVTRYWLPHVLIGMADARAAITSKTD